MNRTQLQHQNRCNKFDAEQEILKGDVPIDIINFCT